MRLALSALIGLLGISIVDSSDTFQKRIQGVVEPERFVLRPRVYPAFADCGSERARKRGCIVGMVWWCIRV
jgi:hypothetical protein